MIGKKLSALLEKNILLLKKEKIYPGYVSKQNSNREKQFILLMIPNREGLWELWKLKCICNKYWNYEKLKQLAVLEY